MREVRKEARVGPQEYKSTAEIDRTTFGSTWLDGYLRSISRDVFFGGAGGLCWAAIANLEGLRLRTIIKINSLTSDAPSHKDIRSVTTPIVGFAECLKYDDPLAYLAALVTVNLSGEPQEFVITKPTVIDTFRRIIWGSSLEPYLFSSHFLPKMTTALKKPPEAMFVRQPLLLSSREFLDVPVLAIFEECHNVNDANCESIVKISDPLGSSTQLFLRSHPKFPGDVAIGASLLPQLAAACFPLELFSRLEEAIRFAKDRLAAAGAQG